MTAATTSLIMDDEGLFFNTGQTNYGPLAISEGFTLTKLEVFGHISVKSQVLVLGDTYVSSTRMFGVQWGFGGYTPYDFATAGEIDGHTWLFAQSIGKTAIEDITWSPSTNDANHISSGQFYRSMYFQVPSPSETREYYLSIGDFTTGTPFEYKIFGTFRLWYE